MTWRKPATYQASMSWAIVLMMGFTLVASPAQADWWWPPSWFARRSGWGPPSGNSSSAAHRGGTCAKAVSNLPLTALAPTPAQKVDELVLGATATDYPTLWFYLPYDIGVPPPVTPPGKTLTRTITKPFAELQLEEQDAKEHDYNQRTIMTLPETKAGIVGIRLTAGSLQAPLEVGKLYHWLLVVHCIPGDASANKFTRLSLLRVAPDPRLTAQLEQTVPAQQRAFYVKYGLWEAVKDGVWNDFITTFADRRCQAPNDPILTAKWSQSLRDVGLQSIATQPLLCPPSPR